MNDEKARRVREMFDGIAHRYDFLNHFLSLGTDVYWRRRAVRRMRILKRTEPLRILDLCCGTGDMALAVSRLGPVVGCDLSHPMLVRGLEKIGRRQPDHPVVLAEGDALRLPFPDGAFDAVTVAFGVRNFADVPAGLREMGRVLRPGGVAGVLEFSHPVLPGFRQLFLAYFHRVLPALGRWVSGRAGAYSYLPASVMAFPSAPAFARDLEAAGFVEVGFDRFTAGVAAFHWGRKPPIR
jgi:demethylmenaquinone methyltransferase/2-methoxy-6-polyprenyl-1,4-benzoquinol methylase